MQYDQRLYRHTHSKKKAHVHTPIALSVRSMFIVAYLGLLGLVLLLL
ncbi:MAG: hypothetical protein ACMXYC_01845 [Candidatus Woesearchaeota archaeon]